MTVPSTTSYDEVPYADRVHPATHPDLLAVVATLFGMSPARPDRCRVLELGCASGANLIALAETLPGSSFVGIDLSPRQVAVGRQKVRARGLTNVALHAMSLVDVGEALGLFDYVLCHGVYSWVPAEVRDRILAVCSSNLMPQGVAYVSYNCYPGWHARAGAGDDVLPRVPLRRPARSRAGGPGVPPFPGQLRPRTAGWRWPEPRRRGRSARRVAGRVRAPRPPGGGEPPRLLPPVRRPCRRARAPVPLGVVCRRARARPKARGDPCRARAGPGSGRTAAIHRLPDRAPIPRACCATRGSPWIGPSAPSG